MNDTAALSSPISPDSPAVARVRLLGREADKVVLGIAGTNYQLHLGLEGNLTIEVGKRARGVIRTHVWKLDFVSAGGAFVEPVYGRPRRVQGTVEAPLGQGNAIIVDVAGCPIVGMLPERWQADDIKPGTRVGLDVYDSSVFQPIA